MDKYLAYLSLTVNQANELLLEKDYRLYDMELGNFVRAPRLVYAHRGSILIKNVHEYDKIFITKMEEKLLTLESQDRNIGVEISDFLKKSGV